MKDKLTGKQVVIMLSIIALAVGLFVGGMELTDRYKKTIVNTYDKYYNKYYSIASSYVDQGQSIVQKNIELASQQDEK